MEQEPRFGEPSELASPVDLDLIARRNSVRNSIAITVMEGGQPSAYCREQLGLFEAGKISVTEMRDRVVRNAGR
jgi:hypothetical protein